MSFLSAQNLHTIKYFTYKLNLKTKKKKKKIMYTHNYLKN